MFIYFTVGLAVILNPKERYIMVAAIKVFLTKLNIVSFCGMASEHTAEWMSKLIDRGEDVGQCIAFLKELAEKEEKLAERNEKKCREK